MARVLVLYGTSHGHTAKVARALTTTLNQAGCFAVAVDASGPMRRVRATEYEAIIVAASLRAGDYQPSVRRWLAANRAALPALPTAFLSVCLGVLERKPEVDRELRAIIDRFTASVGWTPSQVKIVAGALPYTRYGWLTKRLMRHMAARAGGDTDVSRDFEYTDWNDLRAFGQAFVSRHGLARLPEAELMAAT